MYKTFDIDIFNKFKSFLTIFLTRISILENKISGLNKEDEFDISNIIDHYYPIGTIYLTDTDISPEVFLGGTWEEISINRYLRVSDSFNNSGNNTIISSHSHTISHTHTASHSHTVNSHTHSLTSGYALINPAGVVGAATCVRGSFKSVTAYTANAGGTDFTAATAASASGQTNGIGLGGNSGAASASGTSTETATTSAASTTNSGNQDLTITITPEYQGVFAWRRIE